MPDKFPSFERKNNYVLRAGEWVEQAGTGEPDPDYQDPMPFEHYDNYVWDPGTQEWVPQ